MTISFQAIIVQHQNDKSTCETTQQEGSEILNRYMTLERDKTSMAMQEGDSMTTFLQQQYPQYTPESDSHYKKRVFDLQHGLINDPNNELFGITTDQVTSAKGVTINPLILAQQQGNLSSVSQKIDVASNTLGFSEAGQPPLQLLQGDADDAEIGNGVHAAMDILDNSLKSGVHSSDAVDVDAADKSGVRSSNGVDVDAENKSGDHSSNGVNDDAENKSMDTNEGPEVPLKLPLKRVLEAALAALNSPNLVWQIENGEEDSDIKSSTVIFTKAECFQAKEKVKSFTLPGDSTICLKEDVHLLMKTVGEALEFFTEFQEQPLSGNENNMSAGGDGVKSARPNRETAQDLKSKCHDCLETICQRRVSVEDPIDLRLACLSEDQKKMFTRDAKTYFVRFNELEQQKIQMESDIELHKQQCESKRAENEKNLKKTVRESEAKKKQLQTEINEVQSQLKTERDTLNKDLEEKRNKIQEEKGKLDSIRKEVTEQDMLLKNLVITNEENSEQALDEAITALREKASNAMDDYNFFTEQKNELEEEITALKQNTSDLQREKVESARVKSENDKLQREVAKANENLDSLRKGIQSYKQVQKNNTETIKKHAEKIQSLSQEIDDKEKTLKDLKDQENFVKLETTELKNTLDLLNTDHEKKTEALDETKKEMTKAQEELRDVQENLQSVKKERDRLKQEKEMWETACNTFQTKYNTLVVSNHAAALDRTTSQSSTTSVSGLSMVSTPIQSSTPSNKGQGQSKGNTDVQNADSDLNKTTGNKRKALEQLFNSEEPPKKKSGVTVGHATVKNEPPSENLATELENDGNDEDDLFSCNEEDNDDDDDDDEMASLAATEEENCEEISEEQENQKEEISDELKARVPLPGVDKKTLQALYNWTGKVNRNKSHEGPMPVDNHDDILEFKLVEHKTLVLKKLIARGKYFFQEKTHRTTNLVALQNKAVQCKHRLALPGTGLLQALSRFFDGKTASVIGQEMKDYVDENKKTLLVRIFNI